MRGNLPAGRLHRASFRRMTLEAALSGRSIQGQSVASSAIASQNPSQSPRAAPPCVMAYPKDRRVIRVVTVGGRFVEQGQIGSQNCPKSEAFAWTKECAVTKHLSRRSYQQRRVSLYTPFRQNLDECLEAVRRGLD